MRSIIAALLLSIPLSASEFFVSTTGNDNFEGTKNAPFATFSYSLNQLKNGDTLTLLPGTYFERFLFNEGASENILIRGIGSPTIDGSKLSSMKTLDGLMEITGKKHIAVRGITVRNSYGTGIHFPGKNSYVTVDSCRTENTFSSGIIAWFNDSVAIRNCQIINGCNWGNPEVFVPSDSGKNGIQECLSLAFCDSFDISNNVVSGSGAGFDNIANGGGEGIDVKCNVTNGVVRNNYVEKVQSVGIYVDSYDKLLQNVLVTGNRVYRVPLGIIVASEKGGTCRHVIVENNVVDQASYIGIGVKGKDFGDGGSSTKHYLRDITVRYNTVYKTGRQPDDKLDWGDWATGIEVSVDSLEADSIYVIGNISSDNRTQGFEQDSASKHVAHLAFKNNLFWGEGTLPKGVGNRKGNPLFTNAEKGIFTLEKGSAAATAGNPSEAPKTDFTGALRHTDHVSLGAFEFFDPSSLTDKKSPILVSGGKITCSNHGITISYDTGLLPQRVQLFSIDGKCIANKTDMAKVVNLTTTHPGIYILKEQFESSNLSRKVLCNF